MKLNEIIVQAVQLATKYPKQRAKNLREAYNNRLTIK